jgi:glucose-6-phosphate 1-dehydrogenase
MEETVGVEGRGSFYEEAGVIRDVFQNHLLQLVALVAMEPPARYDARSVRNEKVKVFEAMECAGPDEAVFGQYVTGGGMEGYREEEGVSPESSQATFAAVEFRISNWRWQGVPFFVRSGKRLRQKATEIVLHYRIPPHNPFDLSEKLRGDRLILRISPDEGISIRFNIKDPGQEQDIRLDRMNLDFSYSNYFPGPVPDAYETLLLDVMHGDATLFMRADEVEAQWRVVAPLLDLSSSTGPVPEFYAAGSIGPRDAYRLPERTGRHWHRPGND